MGHASRLALSLALGILLPLPLAAQQDAGKEQSVTPEQKAQIEAAKSVDDLVKLGKQFLLNGKTQAAQLCVELICTKDPKLLTDSERAAASKQWHEFWFTSRAQLQEKKLAPDDAVGRVKLAVWLQEAGLINAARSMNAAALRIQPELPQAVQLAAQLEPGIGLDFRYALTKPVLLTDYMDSNVKVEATRGYGLLLAPVHYHPKDMRFNLSPGTLKTVSDAGKHGRVLGLLLTEEPPKAEPRTGAGATGGPGARPLLAPKLTVTSASPPQPSALSAQPPDSFTNTFYERLQLETKDGVPMLIWQNTITSRAIETPAVTPGGTRGTGGVRSTGGRSTGGTGAGAGAANPRDSLAERRGETVPNGWFGLLVKYPDDALKLTIELPDIAPETIDLNLLKLVQSQLAGSGASGQPNTNVSMADLVKEISVYVTDPAAPTAQLALAWLGDVLASNQPAGAPGQADSLGDSITMTLLTAMGHTDRRARQAAFDGLMRKTTPPADEALEFVREKAAPQVTRGLLAEIQATLDACAAASKNADPTAAPPPAGPGYSPAIQRALEGIPVSSAPANLFVLLGACLTAKHSQTQGEALRILLADGSQQSMRILAEDFRPGSGASLIGQFGEVKNDQMKAAVLRMLLARAKPDAKMLTAFLKSCGSLSVKVAGEDDPLLTILKVDDLDKSVRRLLLDLLSRSDLTAVANSQSFGTILTNLNLASKKEPEVRSALLSLATNQFQAPYEAPIPRNRTNNPTAEPGQSSAAEKLLAELAMQPDVDKETAVKAAITLIASGHITALKDEFVKEATDPGRTLAILQALSKKEKLALGAGRNLWDRESLPMFLASCLTGHDKTVQSVLSILTAIEDDCPPQNRWRVALAIRQGVDQAQLIKLTAHNEDRIAELSMGLLKRVAMLTSEQAHELELLSGEEPRASRLQLFTEKRTGNPVGQYACLVCVDLEIDRPASAAPAPGDQPQGGKIARNNVPLASTKVSIERTSDNGVRVVAEQAELARIAGTPGDAGSDRKLVQGDLSAVSILPLLTAALKSDDARKEGLYGKVDFFGLPSKEQEPKCDLKPEAFGGWAGEVTISSSGQTTPEKPARVLSAKIMLQPLSQ